MPSPPEAHDTWVQPLVALVGGAFLGFVWFLSVVVNKGIALRNKSIVGHALLALLTTCGGVFLLRWGGSVSPANGLCWVGGIAIGFWSAYQHVMKATVEAVLVESGHHERSQVASLVKSELLREGSRVAKQNALESILRRQRPEQDAVLRATAQLHHFIHYARSRAVREFVQIGRNFAEALANRGTFTPNLHAYLEEVVGLYRELLVEVTGAGEGLWVALRCLDRDGSYATILRKGIDDSVRGEKSEAVPPNRGLPKALEDDLNQGKEATRGVIILGPDQKRKPKRWQQTENDKRNEDPYTMAAPITIRRCDKDGNLKREMIMILYANHTQNVFMKWHCNIIRCVVDTVSTTISVGIQLMQAAHEHGASMPST
jgi:hypothetical protein